MHRVIQGVNHDIAITLKTFQNINTLQATVLGSQKTLLESQNKKAQSLLRLELRGSEANQVLVCLSHNQQTPAAST